MNPMMMAVFHARLDSIKALVEHEASVGAIPGSVRAQSRTDSAVSGGAVSLTWLERRRLHRHRGRK